MTLIFFGLMACSEKSSTDTANGENTEENGSNCPNEVPEEFRYTWDCTNEFCNGATLYRIGEGATIADGTISLSEEWLLFDGVEPCIDRFEITGIESDTNPDLFGCTGCERIFEATWTLTDMQCNINWGNLFAEQESEDQIYVGYLLLDTHRRVNFTDPEERYEDNFFVLSAAPVNNNQYTYIADYGAGTAIPEGGNPDVGGPEVYSYTSGGTCLE